MPVTMEPIGLVRSPYAARPAEGWGETVSRIELDPRLEEHLEGLEGFSHAVVLYWMHLGSPEDRAIARVRPRGRQDLPLVGVFATRSQRRPNPIGLTVVEILKIEGAALTVRGLDALDGSPVLDIKPFLPSPGIVARCPAWVEELRRDQGCPSSSASSSHER